MNEITDAITIGIPYASIILALVCVAFLYSIVGAWLVSTNYKIVAFFYFLLSGIIGFISISYIMGVIV